MLASSSDTSRKRAEENHGPLFTISNTVPHAKPLHAYKRMQAYLFFYYITKTKNKQKLIATLRTPLNDIIFSPIIYL